MDEIRPLAVPWNAAFQHSYVYQVTWHRMVGTRAIASGAMMPLHRTREGAEKDLVHARSLILDPAPGDRLCWTIEERPIDT